MTLREKAAWAGLIGTQGLYALWFLEWLPIGAPLLLLVHFLLLALVQVLLAARHGAEGADERDRQIAAQAAAIGFFVAIGGLAFAVLMLGFGTSPATLTLVLVAGFALADLSRYGTQCLLYRAD